MDREKILIGMWLKGQYLKDLKEIDETDFKYEKIVNLLKAGKNALEIHETTGIPMAELMGMTVDVQPIFYKQALYEYHKDKLKYTFATGNYSFDEIKDAINRLEGMVYQVTADKEYALGYMQELEMRAKHEVVKWAKLPSLNSMTGGIRQKELTTIAARPSVGKSAFALQIAIGAKESGKKVLYFPLEMSKAQTFDRILQSKGIANSGELRDGKFVNSPNYAIGLTYIDELEKGGNFKVYEGLNKIEAIEAAIKQEKPFLVIVDQLTQLRSENRFPNVRERFSYMTATLKMIAMREDVAIILLAQVNRDAQNSEPSMANLKESGSIEEDSDNVILLHKVDKADTRNPNSWRDDETPLLIKLDKQRSGETGEFLSTFANKRLIFYEKAR